MSEETCVSQFQHLVKTKFEEGGVEELLHLLKSGGQDDVLVNQLAEYLMVSDNYRVQRKASVLYMYTIKDYYMWDDHIHCISSTDPRY